MSIAFFVGVVALSVIMTGLVNASRGSLILAVLFHFPINNPVWPDGRPWDFLPFVLAALLIVFIGRETMLTGKNSVKQVLLPRNERS